MDRGFPCDLVNPLLREDAFSYYKLVVGAQVCNSLTVLVHVAQSLRIHDSVVAVVVSSDFGIKISHEYRHVFPALSTTACSCW